MPSSEKYATDPKYSGGYRAVNKGGKRKDGTDWNTPRPNAPEDYKPLGRARANPANTCGFKKKGRRPCRHWKGFRTDHPGKGYCYKHVGTTPNNQKHWLIAKAMSHWKQNGKQGRPPVNPEAAASYLLSMWSEYVGRLDEQLGEWDELGGNERQVLMGQLHVFSTDLSNLATQLMKLGYRGPVLGEDMARAVVGIMEATLGQFQWGTDKALDIDSEDIIRVFLEEWERAEKSTDEEIKQLTSPSTVHGDAGREYVVSGTARDVESEGGSESVYADGVPSLPYEMWKRGPLKRELEDRGLEVGGPRAAMAKRLREDDRREGSLGPTE